MYGKFISLYDYCQVFDRAEITEVRDSDSFLMIMTSVNAWDHY